MQDTERLAVTIRSETQTVSIEADPSLVFAFLADPQNLPLWAVGFCRRIRYDDEAGRWIVTTAEGEIPIRYAIDRSAGTIDFHFSPAPGVEMMAYSRVVPNSNGSEYIFTQFQAPGMSDAVFESQLHALAGELVVLRGVLHARAACRT
jgi:hypothetical protein